MRKLFFLLLLATLLGVVIAGGGYLLLQREAPGWGADKVLTLTLDAPGYKDPIFAAPSLGAEASLASSPESSPKSSSQSSASHDPESRAQAVNKKGTTGKISMVREDGQWKIEKESWMSGD